MAIFKELIFNGEQLRRHARFKLLSHKAEVLHPALVQQLHARGGPEEETNNTEATKNPLTSLRFWVPIFDGLVLPGRKTEFSILASKSIMSAMLVALFGSLFFFLSKLSFQAGAHYIPQASLLQSLCLII